jgi:hypothetical protein
MRDAIEVVYAQRIKAAGHRFPADLPFNVTPLGWHFILHETSEGLTPEQFEVHAVMAGSQLAGDGFGHGCTAFARLVVKDRKAAQVQGSTRVHKRPRVFVVHATGWKGD